jgi:hypothetical protein
MVAQFSQMVLITSFGFKVEIWCGATTYAIGYGMNLTEAREAAWYELSTFRMGSV